MDLTALTREELIDLLEEIRNEIWTGEDADDIVLFVQDLVGYPEDHVKWEEE